MAGARPNLTEAEAATRKARVGAVAYRLELDLRDEGYTGRCELRFERREPGPLWLDYQGREVRAWRVNGVEVDPARRDGARLPLEAGELRAGENLVEVEFASAYDTDGSGLYRARDPEDGAAYVYSVMPPFEAGRVLPCFDQPDLKGTLELVVDAPASWVVLGNAPERGCRAAGARARREFQGTPPLPTYLFSVAAGPFASWEDEGARVPSRLFAPRSMARFVDVEELFELTRAGIEFFEGWFETPFPFAKYDQVFCPHFNWGAMENAGCVLHSDGMLFRHQATLRERLDRADTVLHELSHMWFGNLVTMAWWNDLWLNESFATFMASLALERAAGHGERAWEHFAHEVKDWAVWQDGLPTTHPIETPVPDTDTTFTNFDGITYGKGAATLRQLAFYLGEEAFRRGVVAYLRAHAWGNARRQDFLACLGEAAGRDLGGWAQAWLQRAGVNDLRVEAEVAEGRLKRLGLRQTRGNGDGALRPQRLRVAIYGRGGGEPQRIEEVELDGPRVELAGAEGLAVPFYVDPNHGDLGYLRPGLDPVSRGFALERVNRLASPLARLGAWRALWYAVRDGELAPGDFLDAVARQVGKEPDAAVLFEVLDDAWVALERYLEPAAQVGPARKLQRLAWRRLRDPGLPGDERSVWMDVLQRSARGSRALGRLAGILAGEVEVPGLDLDPDRRWAILAALAGGGYRGAAELLEAEAARDGSDRGRQALARARCALPDATGKAAAWARFREDRVTPLGLLRAAMQGFWVPGQEELLRPYVAAFFDELPALVAARAGFEVDAVVTHLFPRYAADAGTIRRARRARTAAAEGPAVLLRRLTEELDELSRALRVRRKFG